MLHTAQKMSLLLPIEEELGGKSLGTYLLMKQDWNKKPFGLYIEHDALKFPKLKAAESKQL